MKKKTEKQLKKEKRRELRGFKRVYAKYDCGCCTAEMFFRNKENVIEAFAKAGLQNGAKIVDDKGNIHEGIDTFYGFSMDKEEQHDRGLKYLAGM